MAFFLVECRHMKTLLKIVGGLVVLLIVFGWVWPFGTVGAGERGILLRWSAVTGKVFGEHVSWGRGLR
jgi:hypothetical protein